MPTTRTEDAGIHWRLEGPEEAATLVLLHGIGADVTLFDAVVPLLAERFRVLRIDVRGHGGSEATDGDYDLALLARDVVAVLADAGVAHAVVGGVSLGGMIALRVALDAPGLVDGLVLACTSAQMDVGFWTDRVALVREQGMAAVRNVAVERVLSPAYATAHPEALDIARERLGGMDPRGYAGCGAAIRDMALLGDLPRIPVPALVIGGSADVATPWEEHGARIAAALPDSRVALLETGHWSCVERPREFAAAILDAGFGTRS